ncbi:MAG TPA: isoprenylcysteine carboxylmethyltransferase family protein, partial [Bacteroidota bacterium]|nr:isoprenylcysteine carboxylmethyltransferase family protein [Bacteroidota bacterium]
PTLFRSTLFLAVSAYLFLLSRNSLRRVGSHGFYRFFAWESILALVLLNSRSWFADPLSAVQIISWSFLALSLLLLVRGVDMLRRSGKAGKGRHDESLFPFEQTTALVTTGIYRHIRHPLYGSLLFLGWGAFLKDISLSSAGLAAVATASLIATAKADEAECAGYFGQPYRDYMRKSKMFIPYLF